ncbi:class I SAM-dependent RNA methyltransferase [Aestuariivita boseongensis]|uniref:class I SAM-dependent RNA methyltransferase n=1 Tax=Aestuariivita boseongensis TaxID=1470562 RepID=UPI000681156D|nr:class I SAM-dependent RNA methyltransferase [Aestuariivita boseongensis]
MQQFTIIRLGHQGDGIAEGPVFAPRTLPGEVVSGQLDGKVLTDIRIDMPSDDRVKPPCPHYKSCGGCALQHASDAFVADFKVGVVRQALDAQGIAADIRGIHTSPPRSRRRATLAARRTKKGVLVGFHARASDTITEIPECHLLTPDLLAARPAIADLAMAGASRKGAMAVTVTQSDQGLDLLVRGGKPLDGPLQITLAAIADRHDLARLTWEDEVIVTRRNPEQTFGAARVTPPPGAFLQATQDSEARLLSAVKEATQGASRIIDLFAGCGTFALPLAQTAEVHAVEGDRAMTAALDKGWRHATGLKRVTVEARDLFRNPIIAEDLAGFDAAVIDPPRAGAETQTEQLAAAQIPRIAFVSCNPVTFARDAKTLIAAGYCLDWVQVVDQFRWSAHVELAASFTLSHMALNEE